MKLRWIRSDSRFIPIDFGNVLDGTKDFYVWIGYNRNKLELESIGIYKLAI